MAKENILDRSIDDVDFDVRVLRAMDVLEIKTIRDLVKCSEGEILRAPNFGRKSFLQVKEILYGNGLHLGMSDEEISEKDQLYKGYYAKQNVAKTIDVILDKHKWSEEDIDDLFKDHEKVLAVYKKSLKELFKDET
jgi:hypothetical protein